MLTETIDLIFPLESTHNTRRARPNNGASKKTER